MFIHYVLDVVAFKLQWQRWVVVVDTSWPEMLNYLHLKIFFANPFSKRNTTSEPEVTQLMLAILNISIIS